MTLLLLPIATIAVTWLTWEAYCTYDEILPVDYLDDFNKLHKCDDPGNCRVANLIFGDQRRKRRNFRTMAAVIVLGLVLIAVLVARLAR